jgi:preprotein translocase subunit SecE
MNQALTFLREVRVELGKVSWPTREQMIQYTAVVIGLCLFFALFLGGLDSVFASILKRFVQ